MGKLCLWRPNAWDTFGLFARGEYSSSPHLGILDSGCLGEVQRHPAEIFPNVKAAHVAGGRTQRRCARVEHNHTECRRTMALGSRCGTRTCLQFFCRQPSKSGRLIQSTLEAGSTASSGGPFSKLIKT